MNTSPEKLLALLVITERGSGKGIIETLNRHQIKCHFRCTGQGTAPSEMMDILGLGTSEKDVIFSLGTAAAVEAMTQEVAQNLSFLGRGKGIMIQLAPRAINNMAALLIQRGTGTLAGEGVKFVAKNEYKHSLILVSVNQGYTDAVMQSAKRAGATGGTVIRARMVGNDGEEGIYGIMTQAEKEIISILAPDTQCEAIMTAVNKDCGLKTPAQAILCALPVNKAFKI